MATNIVRLQCACGEEIQIDRELLGHIFPCPSCGRNIRVALQFLMVDQEVAPNLTAVCTCGRFIVAKPKKAGKKATCQMCGRRMVLPEPIKDTKGRGPARIHPKALEKQLKTARDRAQRRSGNAPSRRRSAASRRGQFNLKPGQEVCSNPNCKMPLPPGANICPRCYLNQKAGTRYNSKGPENDPVGSWNLKWVEE